MVRSKSNKKKLSAKEAHARFTSKLNRFKNSYNGIDFEFVFEDEKLQEQFMRTYEFYNQVYGNDDHHIPLMQPVTYQDAKSWVGGAVAKRLNVGLSQYGGNNIKHDIAKDSKGIYHKRGLIAKTLERKQNATSSQFADAVVKLIDLIKKDTDEYKAPTPAGKYRYNVVWYSNGFD